MRAVWIELEEPRTPELPRSPGRCASKWRQVRVHGAGTVLRTWVRGRRFCFTFAVAKTPAAVLLEECYYPRQRQCFPSTPLCYCPLPYTRAQSEPRPRSGHGTVHTQERPVTCHMPARSPRASLTP